MNKNTTNRFFIVNTFDRPDQFHITEEVNGNLYYVHPNHVGYGPMSTDAKTPVEDFGIDLLIGKDNELYGALTDRPTKATYQNGEPRYWQGASAFKFQLTNDPTQEKTSP